MKETVLLFGFFDRHPKQASVHLTIRQRLLVFGIGTTKAWTRRNHPKCAGQVIRMLNQLVCRLNSGAPLPLNSKWIVRTIASRSLTMTIPFSCVIRMTISGSIFVKMVISAFRVISMRATGRQFGFRRRLQTRTVHWIIKKRSASGIQKHHHWILPMHQRCLGRRRQ